MTQNQKTKERESRKFEVGSEFNRIFDYWQSRKQSFRLLYVFIKQISPFGVEGLVPSRRSEPSSPSQPLQLPSVLKDPLLQIFFWLPQGQQKCYCRHHRTVPIVLGVPEYPSTWATVPVEADVTTWAVLRALRLRLRLSTSAVQGGRSRLSSAPRGREGALKYNSPSLNSE